MGMADRESEVLAKLAPGVSSVDAGAWDPLCAGDPFLSHAFLSALEQSGSVGLSTGWSPAPILIEDEGRLLAAAPAYLKGHSQGEYVFDHGWAEAWQNAGGQYYPKLQLTRSRCRISRHTATFRRGWAATFAMGRAPSIGWRAERRLRTAWRLPMKR